MQLQNKTMAGGATQTLKALMRMMKSEMKFLIVSPKANPASSQPRFQGKPYPLFTQGPWVAMFDEMSFCKGITEPHQRSAGLIEYLRWISFTTEEVKHQDSCGPESNTVHDVLATHDEIRLDENACSRV
jgi:hypothetical protein